jgi:hypothetical protein
MVCRLLLVGFGTGAPSHLNNICYDFLGRFVRGIGGGGLQARLNNATRRPIILVLAQVWMHLGGLYNSEN